MFNSSAQVKALLDKPIARVSAWYCVDTLVTVMWRDKQTASFELTDAEGSLCEGIAGLLVYPDGTKQATYLCLKETQEPQRRIKLRERLGQLNEFNIFENLSEIAEIN